jgi:hypothetical protein
MNEHSQKKSFVKGIVGNEAHIVCLVIGEILLV